MEDSDFLVADGVLTGLCAWPNLSLTFPTNSPCLHAAPNAESSRRRYFSRQERQLHMQIHSMKQLKRVRVGSWQWSGYCQMGGQATRELKLKLLACIYISVSAWHRVCSCLVYQSAVDSRFGCWCQCTGQLQARLEGNAMGDKGATALILRLSLCGTQCLGC